VLPRLPQTYQFNVSPYIRRETHLVFPVIHDLSFLPRRSGIVGMKHSLRLSTDLIKNHSTLTNDTDIPFSIVAFRASTFFFSVGIF